MAVTLLDVLDNSDGLLLSLVGKHRSESGVTDAANVGELGAVLRVDDDTPALVKLKSNVLEAKATGIGATADGNKDDIGIKLEKVSGMIITAKKWYMKSGASGTRKGERCHCLLRRSATGGMPKSTYGFGLATLGRVDLDLDSLAALVSADNLGSSLEVNSLLLQDLLRLLGNLKIHSGATDDVEELDNSDLGSQSRPHGGHLKADNTATDDEELLGNLL